jgi:hypothetical protein
MSVAFGKTHNIFGKRPPLIRTDATLHTLGHKVNPFEFIADQNCMKVASQTHLEF